MCKRWCSLAVWICGLGPLGAEQVYESQFGAGVSPERWTRTTTYEVPETGETVLGRFLHQGSARLHLAGLPEHQMVRLRFDLLLFGEFMGAQGEKTYDGFSIGQANGPLLLTTNFSNQDAAGSRQHFPDEFAGPAHPAKTGRLAKDGQHRYRFDLSFPHQGEELSLYFRGRVSDKESGWAFADVKVDVLDKPANLDAARADTLWSALQGEEAMTAHRAAWDLIACGDAGREAVRERWQKALAQREAAAAEELANVAKVYVATLPGLGHDDFVERQQASAAIGKLGAPALPLIEKSLADEKVSAEVRAHLRRIKGRVERKASAVDPARQRLDSRVAQILRVLDPGRLGMRVESSRTGGEDGWDGAKAVIDGYVPPSTGTIVSPRFTWYPKFIGDGWLRIDLPEAREISELGVFWFFDGWGTEAPASWRIHYLDGDGKTWKAVENPAPARFGVEPDKFNQVRFDAVTTTAVKISVTFNGEKSTGVHEVTVK